MYNGFVVQDRMLNNKKYDGNTFKFGITVDNQNYIVKLPKDSVSSLYSEHIASQFIRNIGISCHETWLGYYNSQLVVILKDFTSRDVKLKSYRSTKQSSADTDIDDKEYTYDDVIHMIKKHTKMSDYDKQLMIKHFWDMFICDAILGNRDRHWGNWGYLDTPKGYKPAPLYDNGGSLFPDINTRINEYIELYNHNKEFKFIEDRAEKFPASLFKMEREDGKLRRTNYNEILSDLRINKVLAFEVKRLKTKVGFNGVYESIVRAVESVRDLIPVPYRRFYIIIVCVRYLHMIERKSIKQSYIEVTRRLCNEWREL